MLVRLPLISLLAQITLLVLPMLPDWSGLAHANKPKGLETVQGRGCQSYGGRETPDMARRGAEIRAQENAIRNHGVFIRSYKRVNNLQLEEEIIETFSAGKLERIKFKEEEKKEDSRTICVTVTAKLNPKSLDDFIQQRADATEIIVKARSTLAPAKPAFGLKVWTNNADGRFVENDHLIVFVQSERDTYLMLDYFQADGMVAHLVPNEHRDQVFIEGGKTYAFGEVGSPDEFVVSGPYFGREMIKAMATARMVEPSVNKDTSHGEKSRDYMQRMEGVELVSAEASVEITTESPAVSAYRKKKNELRTMSH